MAISSYPLLPGSAETAPAEPSSSKPTSTGKGLSRWWVPSLLDCLYLSLLFWMFAGGPSGWLGLLADGDTGWHIRTGEYVLTHGQVPHQDLFSFSKPGEAWYAWEWLADVVLALLYRWSGLKGVVLLAAVLIPLSSVLVMRNALKRGANLLTTLLIGLLGVGASAVHYLARPHVFTLFLLALSTGILLSDRIRQTRAVWLLVPLMALWTNLHGGFAALLACLGLLAMGVTIEAFWFGPPGPERWNEPKRYWILTALCAAATLVNPFGFRLHMHIAGYLRSDWIRNAVQEFQSPTFRDESAMHYEILLALGFIAAAALLRRRRIADALPILFWAHMSLSSVRHVPIFVIVAAPLVAAELTRWWQAAVTGRDRRSLAGILDALQADLQGGLLRTSAVPLLAVAALAMLDRPVKWPKDFPAEKFPVALINRHATDLAGGRAFTSDQWADYLIFRSYPQQRVFFDGRSDFYGPQLGREYVRLVQAQWDWEKLAEKHGFTHVLAQGDWPLATVLKRHQDWRVVEDSGQAILFRRVPVQGTGTSPQAAALCPGIKKKNILCLMKGPKPAEELRGDPPA